MRPKPHDDTLDALPVLDDNGDAQAPEPVAPDAAATLRAVLESLRDVLTAGKEVRSVPPWMAPVSVPRPSGRHARFLATFSRMTVVDPAQLGDLPDWWRRTERNGRVRVGMRLALGEPKREANGVWRVPARLRSAWLLRSIPVDLLLWPHLGAWTKLCLEPRRRVHVGRRYFAKGHRVLDALTNQLVTELRAGDACGAPTG